MQTRSPRGCGQITHLNLHGTFAISKMRTSVCRSQHECINCASMVYKIQYEYETACLAVRSQVRPFTKDCQKGYNKEHNSQIV